MFMKKTQSRRARGFTLTEAAIVLGIVGLILGAIWVAAAAVYGNMRVNNANKDVIAIVQAVRSLYAQQNRITSGNQTPSMIAAGAVPSDLINGTALTSRFPSGATFVGGTGDGLGIVVQMNRVPQDACINLVSVVAGNTRDIGLTAASGGATGGYAAVATVGTPLTAPKLPTAMSTGCVEGPNRVSFVFTLH